MKNSKIYKSIILFFVFISILSCNKDDDNELILATDLIGEWQRSDFNNEFEYKLVFNADNTGFRIESETDLEEGTEISSLIPFAWIANDNILDINFDGEMVTTNFSINSEGHLLLSDFTNLYFIKLE
ncbi:hypothetical protein AEQU3_02529 [Aequorivita antarctica]|nr:hypothetical protein AEQU3_02529 [Aequorivita antarctica]